LPWQGIRQARIFPLLVVLAIGFERSDLSNIEAGSDLEKVE
jgi:hypothetical protein